MVQKTKVLLKLHFRRSSQKVVEYAQPGTHRLWRWATGNLPH